MGLVDKPPFNPFLHFIKLTNPHKIIFIAILLGKFSPYRTGIQKNPKFFSRWEYTLNRPNFCEIIQGEPGFLTFPQTFGLYLDIAGWLDQPLLKLEATLWILHLLNLAG